MPDALVLQELSCYGINSKYFEEHRGAKKEHSLRSVTDEQRRGSSKDDELYRMNLVLEALVLQNRTWPTLLGNSPEVHFKMSLYPLDRPFKAVVKGQTPSRL